jgi:hypothetical protein
LPKNPAEPPFAAALDRAVKECRPHRLGRARAGKWSGALRVLRNTRNDECARGVRQWKVKVPKARRREGSKSWGNENMDCIWPEKLKQQRTPSRTHQERTSRKKVFTRPL